MTTQVPYNPAKEGESYNGGLPAALLAPPPGLRVGRLSAGALTCRPKYNYRDHLEAYVLGVILKYIFEA